MAVAGNFAAVNSLSKTVSFINQSPRFSKSSSFILSSLSISLFLSKTDCSSFSKFRTSVLHSSELKNDNSEDDDEDYEEFVDESVEIDEDELEVEARVVAHEFSRSLSRELIIEDEAKGSKGAGGKQKRQMNLSADIWSLTLTRKDLERLKHFQIPDHLLPKVAIIGRPNVVKSARR